MLSDIKTPSYKYLIPNKIQITNINFETIKLQNSPASKVEHNTDSDRSQIHFKSQIFKNSLV